MVVVVVVVVAVGMEVAPAPENRGGEGVSMVTAVGPFCEVDVVGRASDVVGMDEVGLTGSLAVGDGTRSCATCGD